MNISLYDAIIRIQMEMSGTEVRINEDDVTIAIDGLECEVPMGPQESEQFINCIVWANHQRLSKGE